MKCSTCSRIATVGTLLLVLSHAVAEAQNGREALLLGTRAYDLADFDEAIGLLSRGVDPSGTPRDNVWVAGVQKLAHALLERGQQTLAETWLRWALRLEPAMSLDSVNFPPSVWVAFDRARTSLAAAGRDTSVAHVTWQWSPARAMSTAGSVVVRSAGPAISARLENGDSLRVGVPHVVIPGTYDILATAQGYEPARVAIEVLPGITTQVVFELKHTPPGFLYVASRPWATVYLDGQRIGYTTIAAHAVTAGIHHVHIEREGHASVDTTFSVNPEQRVRLGPIRLQPRPQ